MSDKKKKSKKNSAGVLSQNKATNMKFVDFKQIGLDAAELGAKYTRRKKRVKRNKKD